MYYLKLIKTHIFYLISKKNIIMISLMNIFSILLTIWISSILDGYYTLDASRRTYFDDFQDSYFLFLKIFYVSFILYINISYFSVEYSSYSCFIIRDRKSKYSFYITKYLSIILFDLIEFIFLSLVYLIVLYLMPYGRYYFEYLFSFIRIFLLGMYYLFLSSLLLLIFKSYFASLFCFLLFFSSIMVSSNNLSKFSLVYLAIFPCPIGRDAIFTYGSPVIAFLIIILALLNFLFISKSDSI